MCTSRGRGNMWEAIFIGRWGRRARNGVVSMSEVAADSVQTEEGELVTEAIFSGPTQFGQIFCPFWSVCVGLRTGWIGLTVWVGRCLQRARPIFFLT